MVTTFPSALQWLSECHMPPHRQTSYPHGWHGWERQATCLSFNSSVHWKCRGTDDLLTELRNPEYASEYLAQALETGGQSTFLLALRDVVEAGGGATVVAKQAKIQTESLYKVLSNRDNPRLIRKCDAG
jgi:DNA-binding phage protein